MQSLSAQAHEILAALIRSGAHVSELTTVTARCEESHLQVVITVAPYEGPMRIHPATLEAIGNLNKPPKLSPLQTRIVDLLKTQAVGRKALWIATRLGVKCGGSFRSLLADLVRFEVLRRADDGGYELCPGHKCP